MKKMIVGVANIQSNESLNIVAFTLGATSLKMMSLALSENVVIGKDVRLNIKATAVAIAKNVRGDLSYSNQLKSRIVCIEHGTLLSSLTLECEGRHFESIITKESAQRMNLQENDEVIALIKANEIAIAEVL
ncbi:TOBE domain-containing protein [Sulfurimonas sp. SAG-AH-194-I05]|nr:TOBE domain-containing protein [Sulfurimonas sp. SAG-AH-194-I05]MDF1874936.1 TOBE domain-containing protein [Sulfurimonas sp. SAG-AH-194-I05]